MIPTRLIRTVPHITGDVVEQYWATAVELHPTWEHVTFRDPIDPAEFPLTSPLWHLCTSGAQFAGLVRLEALYHLGGFYIDSDFELYRSLDPLCGAHVVAGWQDTKIVPDAVIGAQAGHPAIAECIELAIERLEDGAHRSGPDVTTEVFAGRTDVLLLPPGSFYPYHYRAGSQPHVDHRQANPWAIGAHHWHASWVPPAKRDSARIKRRGR